MTEDESLDIQMTAWYRRRQSYASVGTHVDVVLKRFDCSLDWKTAPVYASPFT